MSDRVALMVNKIGTLQLFLLGSAVFVVFLVWQGHYDTALIFFATFVLVMGTVGILKLIFRTARPEEARVSSVTYAFPSGHAAASSFLAVYGGFLFFEHLNIFLAIVLTTVTVIAAGLISFSRLTLQVHTSIQIVVGVMIGVIIPFIALMNQPFILELMYRIIPL